jgi:hypothetical protein
MVEMQLMLNYAYPKKYYKEERIIDNRLSMVTKWGLFVPNFTETEFNSWSVKLLVLLMRPLSQAAE